MKLSQQFLRQISTFLASLVVMGLLPVQGLRANPTGGAVASGSATISNLPGTTTINQSSNAAIINWQTFSINHGESTHFLQPSNQSAVLNRVLGGNSSQINGALNANGQVYLINQNGILVGPGGVVNAAGGFTASTRDISNSDFLNGHLHFVGHGNAGIKNAGQISSSLGNVVLMGKTVSNKGKVSAQSGTVGLIAGDDVLLGQTNPNGATILVAPSQLAKHASGRTAISNTGTIVGAAATLKAANGNIYAMAINNGGTIRATSVSHQGGHILLSSDSGTIRNSGLLNASASSPGGNGGTVQLKSGGTVSHTGTILAKGGAYGIGGSVDISGSKLVFKGSVNLTAPGGTTGDLLLDPTTLQVITGGTGTVLNGQNNSTSTTISPSTVETVLNTANLILNADNSVTISNGINWNSSSTLTLSTNNTGSTISINAPISGASGGLTIQTAGANDLITPSASGSINVGSFILQSGYWNQDSYGNTLATFSVARDFELQGTSTFLRVAGGNGASVTPYQIIDIYGLQGIGSPSNALLGTVATPLYYEQKSNINSSGTATWNGGAGFVSIGNFNNLFVGTYNGTGYSISNITINNPVQQDIGLFGQTDYRSTIKGISISGTVTGSTFVGGVVGYNSGTLENCSTNMTISGASGVGGIAGVNENLGLISDCFSSGSVFGSNAYVGGLVGINSRWVQDSRSQATVSGNEMVGGLVGLNGSYVQDCYSTGTVTGTSGSNMIGGLVGQDGGIIQDCYTTSPVSGASKVGGLVGLADYDSIATSYWATDSIGQTPNLPTVGASDQETIDAYSSGKTLSQLKLESTYDPSWTFTLGTGLWGINGYSSSGQINNGLPYFQWQYPTQAKITPNSQQLVYSGTTGTLNQSLYSISYNPNNSPIQNLPSALFSTDSVLVVVGNNVNVVNIGAANKIGIITPSLGNVVELDTNPATVTYTPKPITVNGVNLSPVTFGTTPSFGQSITGLVNGDSLSISYSTTDGKNAAGYFNVGNYSYSPVVAPNANYSISTTPASFSITPPPFNPNLHSAIADENYYAAYQNAFDYAFMNAKLNAKANAFDAAFEAKYLAAFQYKHAIAYDAAYIYAFESATDPAQAYADYVAFEEAFNIPRPLSSNFP